jgi:hypothetical protein
VRGEGLLGWLGQIQSRRYIFVCYGDGVKGCRLWDPTTQKSSLEKMCTWNNQKFFMIEKGDLFANLGSHCMA